MSKPMPGDEELQPLHQAVGYALSAWESVEETLSALFTVLDKTPGDLVTYKRYGKEGRFFSFRKRLLERAATEFFVSRPSQTEEGEVVTILQMAEDLSSLRNRIAHGRAIQVMYLGDAWKGVFEKYEEHKSLWHLGAPWFAEEQLGTPYPGYNSLAINGIAKKFEQLDSRISLLINELYSLGPP